MGAREFRCSRCKKTFTKRNNGPWCTTLDHIYPAAAAGEKIRQCYCGKSSMKGIVQTQTVTQGDTTMAKKNIVKKSSKKSSVESVERTSNLEYVFLKNPGDMPAEETIMGCVLEGIKKIKRGNLDDATSATVKAGFKEFSDQDAREKTRIMLRRLANDGAVRITRNGTEVEGRSAAPAKKEGKGKKAGKSFKLVTKK